MLTLHQLEITIEAVTPLALDAYGGSALRGAFFHALWYRFCTNHEAKTCYECPLNAACPVSSLVAPLRDEAPRGHDLPRPYIITSSYHEKKQFEPGETYTFNFTLIGNATKLYPYVIRTFQEMERNTLGHPLQQLRGKRGSFLIRKIDEVHSFTNERIRLWQPGTTQPGKLHLSISQNDVREKAKHLPHDTLILNFLSPTRLIQNAQVLQQPSLDVLALRMAQRLEQIHQEYGSSDTENVCFGREWYLSVKEQAQEVHLKRNETKWVDIHSYSSRQHRDMPIGGFVGRALFVGPVTPLRELLVWGELLRVGKNIVKGAGMYKIETE